MGVQHPIIRVILLANIISNLIPLSAVSGDPHNLPPVPDDDDYNLFKEKLMARIPKMSTPLGNIPWIDAVAVMLVLGAAISFGAVAVA